MTLNKSMMIFAMPLLFAACDDKSAAEVDQARYAHGQIVFERLCSSCHDAKTRSHRVGPYLVGVEGRRAGTVSGFDFSPAMRAYGTEWDAKSLDAFIAAPTIAVPGTKMVINPVSDTADRTDVIYYLTH